MWDTYLSESNGFDDYHVYVCAAFLHHFGHKLKKMEFEEALAALTQGIGRLPYGEFDVLDLEVVLSQAYIWRSRLKENRIKEYQMVLPNQTCSSQSRGTTGAKYLGETLFPISLMSDVGSLFS
uniref:Uncharacterized protein n=1 Tax=Ditylum brightwellii TaxID=49249 RepID=A0A7S2ERZ8_9STRA|mmetsp:Transcript_40253/g.60368  ORF Transcript_40253/g.60368 Transcript_40253/m.60368 type:complete len:123 (+) Transcript_40253:2-370(+)